MNLSWIIGTIISVVLTYWGIWHANKSKKRVQLSLVDQNWMTIVNTFEENFKDIKIESFEFPENKNLYYFKGTIMNTGNTDIHKQLIYSPLTISFSGNFKILDYKIDNPKEFMLNAKKQDEIIEINWDLLKPLEKFSFDLIIQTDNSYSYYQLHEKIKTNFRIADLSSIKRIRISDLKNLIHKSFLKNYLGAYFLVTLVFSTGIWLLNRAIENGYKPIGTVKYGVYSKATHQEIELNYHNKDTIEVRFGDAVKLVPKKKLNEYIVIYTTTSVTQPDSAIYIFPILLIFGSLYGAYRTVNEHAYESRMKEMLKTIEIE